MYAHILQNDMWLFSSNLNNIFILENTQFPLKFPVQILFFRWKDFHGVFVL